MVLVAKLVTKKSELVLLELTFAHFQDRTMCTTQRHKALTYSSTLIQALTLREDAGITSSPQ